MYGYDWHGRGDGSNQCGPTFWDAALGSCHRPGALHQQAPLCSNQFTFGSQNFADIDGICVIICADRIGYDGDGMGVVSLVSVFEGKSAWNWLLLNHAKTYKAHQVQHDYVTMYVQRNSIQGSAAVQLCLEAVCIVAVR
jgi:hypothetical protein